MDANCIAGLKCSDRRKNRAFDTPPALLETPITLDERSADAEVIFLRAIGGASRDLPGSRATLTSLDREIVADYTLIRRGSVADDAVGTM